LLHYGSARRARWEFLCDGKKRYVEFQPALNSNNGPFLLDATQKGNGLARLPDFLVSTALHNGDLVPVLPGFEFETFNVQVVYRASRRLNKRMRVLIDALQQGCAVLNENR
jgi:DNA-binding transcriptional LysR family regulator